MSNRAGAGIDVKRNLTGCARSLLLSPLRRWRRRRLRSAPCDAGGRGRLAAGHVDDGVGEADVPELDGEGDGAGDEGDEGDGDEGDGEGEDEAGELDDGDGGLD